MAIVHYDVVFPNETPNLEKVKQRLDQRTGLKTLLSVDRLEEVHSWPHIGEVRQSGTFECDEAADSDLEMTIGTKGVRISCVPDSIHPWFRDSAIATLVDLGGKWEARLSPLIAKKWSELSAGDRQIGGHH